MNKVTSWAVVCTITRPNGTWFDRTITEMPDSVSEPMDQYLTEVMAEEPLILTKEMEVKDGR
tara:strand:+ start:242 stop:427 length:186 start_codon:yes stop_codon:yes gene_type:complete